MTWLKTAFQEIFGLFVDDGFLAVAVLAWLFLIGLVSDQWDAGAEWSGPLLFVGLALILVESAWRRAGKSRAVCDHFVDEGGGEHGYKGFLTLNAGPARSRHAECRCRAPRP